MADGFENEELRLRERLWRYYELLKYTTDLRAIGAIRELIGEIEAKLRESEQC